MNITIVLAWNNISHTDFKSILFCVLAVWGSGTRNDVFDLTVVIRYHEYYCSISME